MPSLYVHVTPTSIEDFIKENRTSIIENGLDGILTGTIKKLQKELMFEVKQQVTEIDQSQSKEVVPVGKVTPSIIPKADEIVVQQLLAIPSLKNLQYTTPTDPNIIFGQVNRGTRDANRLTFRVEMIDGENISDQFQKAKRFFNNAVFALPDSTGRMRYYINPGIDLEDAIKIKCSTSTGDHNNPVLKGLNPKERFQKDATTKGYSDWTLKQAVLDKIRQEFVDITDIVESVKGGDLTTAASAVSALTGTGTVARLSEKAETLPKKEQLSEASKSYFSAIDLINNLKFQKKITPENTTYKLVSQFSSELKKDYVEFYDNLIKTIQIWFAGEHEEIFTAFKKKLERLIEKHNI